MMSSPLVALLPLLRMKPPSALLLPPSLLMQQGYVGRGNLVC
jgi:hypothetical protein